MLDTPTSSFASERLRPRRIVRATPETSRIAAGTVRGWRRSGWRRLASPLAIVLVWQLASSLGLMSAQTLASPWQILQTGWSLIQDGTLVRNLLVSLMRAFSGLAIAIVAGTLLALVAGLSRIGEDVVDAPMQMARTMPVLALVPLFILWFGIGETPKVALVALGALFPIYLNLFKGIRGVDRKLIEAAQTLGLSKLELVRHVILPGALPSFLVGLRYAVGVGWLSLVVGEQINAESGIGFMMMNAREFLRTDIIMVGLLVYALLGLLADVGVRWIEKTALVWRPTMLGDKK